MCAHIKHCFLPHVRPRQPQVNFGGMAYLDLCFMASTQVTEQIVPVVVEHVGIEGPDTALPFSWSR